MADNSDALYVGMYNKGVSNRSDSVIAWGDDTTDLLRFIYAHSDRTDREIMHIRPDGQVGIGLGTDLAQRQLHLRVKPGIQRDYALRIDHAENTAEYWEIGVDRQPGDADLLFNHQGSLRAWIEPASGAWVTNSDRKLKKEIRSMTGVLSKVLELKPRTYKFKNDDKVRNRIGLIAQEVQELFPELVTQKEHMGIDYNGFGVLAVAAIQEQQKTIEQLQEQVKQLMEAVGLSAKAAKSNSTRKSSKKTDS